MNKNCYSFHILCFCFTDGLVSVAATWEQYLISPTFVPDQASCVHVLLSYERYGYYKVHVVSSEGDIVSTSGQQYIDYSPGLLVSLNVASSSLTDYRVYIELLPDSYYVQYYGQGIYVHYVNVTEGACTDHSKYIQVNYKAFKLSFCYT